MVPSLLYSPPHGVSYRQAAQRDNKYKHPANDHRGHRYLADRSETYTAQSFGAM